VPKVRPDIVVVAVPFVCTVHPDGAGWFWQGVVGGGVGFKLISVPEPVEWNRCAAFFTTVEAGALAKAPLKRKPPDNASVTRARLKMSTTFFTV